MAEYPTHHGLAGAEGRDPGHHGPQAGELCPTESDEEESLVGTGKYVSRSISWTSWTMCTYGKVYKKH